MNKFLYRFRFAFYGLVLSGLVKTGLDFAGFNFIEWSEIFAFIVLTVLAYELVFKVDKELPKSKKA